MAYDLLWKASDVLVRIEEPMIKVLVVARRRYMFSVILTEKKRNFLLLLSFLGLSGCTYVHWRKLSFSLIPQIQMLISSGNNMKDIPTNIISSGHPML